MTETDEKIMGIMSIDKDSQLTRKHQWENLFHKLTVWVKIRSNHVESNGPRSMFWVRLVKRWRMAS